MNPINHPVTEGEFYHCEHCGKLTLHEINRNEHRDISSVKCVVCQLPL